MDTAEDEVSKELSPPNVKQDNPNGKCRQFIQHGVNNQVTFLGQSQGTVTQYGKQNIINLSTGTRRFRLSIGSKNVDVDTKVVFNMLQPDEEVDPRSSTLVLRGDSGQGELTTHDLFIHIDNGDKGLKNGQTLTGFLKSLFERVSMKVKKVINGSIIIQLQPKTNRAVVTLLNAMQGDFLEDLVRGILESHTDSFGQDVAAANDTIKMKIEINIPKEMFPKTFPCKTFGSMKEMIEELEITLKEELKDEKKTVPGTGDIEGTDVDIAGPSGYTGDIEGPDVDIAGPSGHWRAFGKILKFSDEDFLTEEYNMNHARRGVAVIFANEHFQTMSKRLGTGDDLEMTTQAFLKLGFDVLVRRNNTCREMKDFIKHVSKKDHSDHDCFVCMVLTNGMAGKIFGVDGLLDMKDLIEPFNSKNCPSLVAKPKLFFIEACEAKVLDEGFTVTDALTVEGDSSKAQTEPIVLQSVLEPDFLMAISTAPGFPLRASKEFGFIPNLCTALEEHSGNMDLVSILTGVIKKCSQKSSVQMGTKYVPCFTSTLLRKVFFHPQKY